jgi:hypothetical protein
LAARARRWRNGARGDDPKIAHTIEPPNIIS